MIIEGVKLMVLGMGTVLVFLVVMIFCMAVMAKLIAPFAHILDKQPAAPKKKSGSDDNALKAAAAAAVAAFHANKSGK